MKPERTQREKLAIANGVLMAEVARVRGHTLVADYVAALCAQDGDTDELTAVDALGTLNLRQVRAVAWVLAQTEARKD